MPQQTRLPEVLERAETADGIVFQWRREAIGVLKCPTLETVHINVHVGTPAKITCQRDGKRFSGTAVHGDVDIVPADILALWEMHDTNETCVLTSLPQKLVRLVADESGLGAEQLEIRNRFQVRDTELEALSWATKREMELGCPSGRLYLDGLALSMASRLVARHSSVAKSIAQANEGLSGRRLKRVLQFIEERLAEDLSLRQIAAVAGVSASHIKTLFRKSVGIPVHQYVIQRRVERAKTLLLQDGLSMAAIAQEAGFAHQSHMARHMRRALGAPPRTIKRLLA